MYANSVDFFSSFFPPYVARKTIEKRREKIQHCLLTPSYLKPISFICFPCFMNLALTPLFVLLTWRILGALISIMSKSYVERAMSANVFSSSESKNMTLEGWVGGWSNIVRQGRTFSTCSVFAAVAGYNPRTLYRIINWPGPQRCRCCLTSYI